MRRRMRRCVLWAIAAIVVLAPAVFADGDDTPFTGFGPAPVRNYQPIQLIFLNLPVERARVTTRGDFDLHLESVEINEIATTQEPRIQSALKFETNRTVIGGKYGVRPGLELGIDLPFLSRFGGFLDPIIDSVESAFGSVNPERSLYPNNSFGAFYVRDRQNDVTLFAGHHEAFQLGDIWFSGKQEILESPGYPLISLRAAIKAPTGDTQKVFGSGHSDFGLGFAAEYQALSWLMLYGDLSGIFPVGPVAAEQLTLNPFVNEAVAAEAQVARNLSLLLQQELYTSPIHGTGTRLLDGTVVEITGGANLRCGSLLLQLAFVENVSGVLTSADFSLMLRASYHHSP